MKTLYLKGVPNKKQELFFSSKAKYTAYGGARGGGKSWALRRKLVLLCLRYAGIKCLIVRRSFPELQYNHILPLRAELGGCVRYSESGKCFKFPNGSVLKLGYMADDGDTLQYQGQEYDIIALDEATQLTEYRFSALKACLRGTNGYPKRMYLSCNPGGIGHAWVKRLFIDRIYREGEKSEDYAFIQATAYDNTVLMEKDSEYIDRLRSLPKDLRRAWLDGSWDVFEGQFFPEINEKTHVIEPFALKYGIRRIGGLDYGFDMLAFVVLAADFDGNVYVEREFFMPNLTLSEAGEKIARVCSGLDIDYISASPDLWNRRQDSGLSGFEIMSGINGMPPLIKADNRRIPGWRALREYLLPKDGVPALRFFSSCPETVRCLSSLTYDKTKTEDASESPHEITHLPEALRYAVMSRIQRASTEEEIYNARKRRYENKNSIAYY